jgi:hypothetical protein
MSEITKFMDTDITDKLPKIATRSEWSRLIGVTIKKLVYEESKGRLKNRQNMGYAAMFLREDILEWLYKYGMR